MAILVFTPKPQALLDAIYAMIDEGVHIDTWENDADGDFTHTPASGQFDGRAWFKPTVESGCLTFSILPQKTKIITVPLYGIYHGRFTEMLLNHFDNQFTNLTVTALARSDWGDVVVGSQAGRP